MGSANNLVNSTIEVIRDFIAEIKHYGLIEWGSLNIEIVSSSKDTAADAHYLVEQFICKLQSNVRKLRQTEDKLDISSSQQSSITTGGDESCDSSKDSLDEAQEQEEKDKSYPLALISDNSGSLDKSHKHVANHTTYITSNVSAPNINVINRESTEGSIIPMDGVVDEQSKSQVLTCSVIQQQLVHGQHLQPPQNQIEIQESHKLGSRSNFHILETHLQQEIPQDLHISQPPQNLDIQQQSQSLHLQQTQDLHLQQQTSQDTQPTIQLHNSNSQSLQYLHNGTSNANHSTIPDIETTDCSRSTIQLIPHTSYSTPLCNQKEAIPMQLQCSKCNCEYSSNSTYNSPEFTSSLCHQCSSSDTTVISINGPSQSSRPPTTKSQPKLKSTTKSILRSPDSTDIDTPEKFKDAKTSPNASRKHTCDKCGRVFSMWKHLSIHYNKVHLDEDGVENNSDLTSGNLEVLSNDSLPVYCCKTCNITCLTPQSFNTHSCRLPSDETNNLLSNRILITNIVKLRQMRKFVCQLCGLEYRNFKHISYHLPRCIAGPYPCNICFVMFDTKRLLNYHKKKMHKGKKCFVCDECGRSFQRRTSLRKHEVSWHESGTAVGPFKCDLCPKKFIKRIYLTNHKLRMHSLNKKFLCQVCGNKFMTQNSLMAHMAIHSDVSRFQCSYCKKQFKRKDKLVHHERLHTGERPFLCQLCGSGFVSKCKLSAHISRHNGSRRYRCPHCTTSYAASWDLKQHIKKIHSKELNKSPINSESTSQGPQSEEDQVTEVIVTEPSSGNAELKKESVITSVESSSEVQVMDTVVEDQQVDETSSNTILGNPQYITVGGGVTIPVVAGTVQSHIPSLGHVVQVSGSSVPLTGMNATLNPPNSSVQAMQAIQTIPGSEYSVHTLQPPTLHTAQGYIFTQGFDMVSGTLQY